MKKELTKSSNKMIAGVVAGIAEYFGWDITWTRIGYTFLSIISAAFPGTLVYIILMFVMPKNR